MVVYRLITANTIDQKILERASAKRKLEQMVIHKSECFTSTEYLHTLLTSFQFSNLMTVSFLSWLFSTDKFKGGKAELNQSKSCIDLDELMELLKARGTEK